MAIKKYVLVKKSDHKVVYTGQVFTIDTEVQELPAGLLGGRGQIDWYWNEVTDLAAGNFDDQGKLNKTTRMPAGGESIDAEGVNVVVPGGTWA